MSAHPSATPAVSVILPTYNRAWCLRRAIVSVLAQTWTDFELLVVDDGSTDNTADVVASIGDARVRYIKAERNAGVSAARNLGVQQARAELIAFQDSDDEWRVEKLERLVGAVRADTGLVACGHICVDDMSMSFLGIDSPEEVLDVTGMVVLRLPGASRWLVRRQLVVDLGGFDVELDCFEDWELALRISERQRVLFVNQPLHLYSKTPDSLFAAESGYARNLKRILSRHGARLKADPMAWAFCCNLIGQSECQHGSSAEGRRWLLKAVAARPFSPRGWVNLLMSLFGAAAFRRYVRVARRLRARVAPAVRPRPHGQDG